MTGKIKFYNQEKEFGFILGNDGEDYWFHISKIPKPPKIIKTNTEVGFDVLTTPRGLNATNIIFKNTDKQENLNATCPVCNTENNLHLKNCKNCNFTLKYVKGWHIQISPSEASEYRKTLTKAKKEYSEKTRKKTRQPNNKTSKKQEKQRIEKIRKEIRDTVRAEQQKHFQDQLKQYENGQREIRRQQEQYELEQNQLRKQQEEYRKKQREEQERIVRNKAKEKAMMINHQILTKHEFETSEEFENRINNMELKQVGTLHLNKYDADLEIYTISIMFDYSIKNKLVSVHDTFQLEYFLKGIFLPVSKAKRLAEKKIYPLYANVRYISNNTFSLVNIHIKGYSFTYDLENLNYYINKYHVYPGNNIELEEDLINKYKSLQNRYQSQKGILFDNTEARKIKKEMTEIQDVLSKRIQGYTKKEYIESFNKRGIR